MMDEVHVFAESVLEVARLKHSLLGLYKAVIAARPCMHVWVYVSGLVQGTCSR
jgi:hypothetical protein